MVSIEQVSKHKSFTTQSPQNRERVMHHPRTDDEKDQLASTVGMRIVTVCVRTAKLRENNDSHRLYLHRTAFANA